MEGWVAWTARARMCCSRGARAVGFNRANQEDRMDGWQRWGELILRRGGEGRREGCKDGIDGRRGQGCGCEDGKGGSAEEEKGALEIRRIENCCGWREEEGKVVVVVVVVVAVVVVV